MKYTVFLLLCMLLTGCRKAESPAAAVPTAPPPGEPRTTWTGKSELFVEIPALISGGVSRLGVHLTRLDNFKPLAGAQVTVELSGSGGDVQRFTADDSRKAGIYGVNVKPAGAGKYRAAVAFTANGLSDRHDLGEVTVFANAEAIPEQKEEGGDGVTFTKEQQWALDYAAAVAQVRDIRSSLYVHGEVLPRSGGTADVSVPFDGRLTLTGSWIVGMRVNQGQVLARVLPPAVAPGDLTAMELARNESSLALQLARRDRERAERLVAAGAAPAKRLDEARTVEATADARLKAAETRLAQFEAASSAEGNPRGGRMFDVRSPITGVIQEVRAAPGGNVKAGDTIFRIVDIETVYVSALVPEADSGKVNAIVAADVELDGNPPRRLTKLISIGRVVDPESRTLPVIYEADNRDRRLAINQGLHLRLFTAGTAPSPVVPESAIIDDNGRPVIYLQTGGETFERRPVKLGLREGAMVQIVEGLSAGERVVIRGAHLIRLASLSGAVPAEGHVH